MSGRDRGAGAWPLLPLALALLAAGCHRNVRQELIEAELRTREIQLHSLRDEMCRLEGTNVALQREVQALRGGGFGAHFPPEEAARTLTLRGITLARGTGGLDEDGKPGDEALQVVVDPRDTDGHALKVPGTLFIQALAVSPEGLKHPVSSWEIPPDQLRRSWKSGLLTNGYSLTLPWKGLPTSDKVRVVARLVLPDGRAFEAERDINVRLVPGLAFPVMPREGEVPHSGPVPIIGPAVPLPPGTPAERLVTPPAMHGPALQPPPVAPPGGVEPVWPAPPPKLIEPPIKSAEPPLPGDMARRSIPSPSGLARTAAKDPPPAPGQAGTRDGLSRAVHLQRPVPVPRRLEWAQ